jgi:hypothetical protein
MLANPNEQGPGGIPVDVVMSTLENKWSLPRLFQREQQPQQQSQQARPEATNVLAELGIRNEDLQGTVRAWTAPDGRDWFISTRQSPLHRAYVAYVATHLHERSPWGSPIVDAWALPKRRHDFTHGLGALSQLAAFYARVHQASAGHWPVSAWGPSLWPLLLVASLDDTTARYYMEGPTGAPCILRDCLLRASLTD